MNFLSVEFIVGRLLLVCSAAMVLPIIFSVILLETDVLSMLASASITAIIGYSMTLHGKNETSLTNREAIMTVCFSWVMLSFCGSLPYTLSGVMSPFHAVLESASGFTTVGATLIPDLNLIPRSVLLWRSMTQWLGGMGVIVLFISFLPHYGSGAINMFNAELPGPSKDRVMPRIADTASLLWKIYTSMTLVFVTIMLAAGLPLFDALTHSLTSISTGGFSPYNEGMRHFNNPLVEILTAIFTLLAAGNFYLYYQVYHRGWKRLFYDIEFKTFIIFILAFTALVTLDLIIQTDYSFAYSLHNSFFHVVSALSTSGIAIADLSTWPPFSKFTIFTLMFVGGCAASTAGGIKIARIIVLFKLSWSELKHTLHPKMISNLTMSGKVINPAIVSTITRHFFVFMAVYFFSTAILTFSGIGVLESLMIMASIIGTAGPDLSFSMLGNKYAFWTINDVGKIAITLCMLLGRLEFFTLLVLLRPEFWRKTRSW